jgi:arginyl-tRNA--protein-N-Asp/Glu arginylyltransferase
MYNQQNNFTIEENYEHGLLPQRNTKNYWYSDSSCRSNLNDFSLSSENRRIIGKTNQYKYQLIPLLEFKYSPFIQKTIYKWIKEIGWDFPISSVKTIFTNHIFNFVYVWQDENNNAVAYSICYFSDEISHIAYVFYNPKLSHDNLPIRLSLQTIIDSYEKKLKYCYLGRFNSETKLGYYKRELPGFQYFTNNSWETFNL